MDDAASLNGQLQINRVITSSKREAHRKMGTFGRHTWEGRKTNPKLALPRFTWGKQNRRTGDQGQIQSSPFPSVSDGRIRGGRMK